MTEKSKDCPTEQQNGEELAETELDKVNGGLASGGVAPETTEGKHTGDVRP